MTEKIKTISGLILAGGENKRFDGIIKSNLVIGGSSIITRIINTISDIFEEIIIVTNTPEKFPFILNSGRILYQYHSSTMSRRSKFLNDFANESYVLINENDLRKYNLSNGEKVTIRSKRGKLVTTLRESNEIAPGELFMPWHYPESPVNNLTRNELDPLSKIAPFKLSACSIEKAE